MLGILFSLAVYNGVTLPVTFPLALYDFLLSRNDEDHSSASTKSLDYIKDGWPGLAKAFGELLAWSDGDVGDTIMREYAFSYEVFGQNVDHNMNYPFSHPKPGQPASPDPSQPEPELVTNANREHFVSDYISFLTHHSISPQLSAFRKGFQTCLHPRSLHLFTPTTFRALIEGSQTISIPSLRRCAKYSGGYSATHPIITTFWGIVEQYSQDDCRRLLEFVTASDRVPVTGYESITFCVVRVAGGEALPTSSTCFGKLYLPEYDGGEGLMGRKLEVAIRNAKGFGVV